ncbi:MBL fold metallo-hydrolase [Acidianus sp. RZ1]|uniref:MBL fold metallo-hydrolase n=1 Tax=Acidianus sp. RZ1 TaxID=1540082 RepID=UPI0014909CE0|nr:MBL fold metallo-hydrolase [Acidianus sp. RZ1]
MILVPGTRIRIAEIIERGFFGRNLNHNVVLTDGPSGGLMIVDTSLPGYLDYIESYLKAWGYSLEDISDIVITHSHEDHAGNAEEIRKISKAKVYAHQDEVFGKQNYRISYEQVRKEIDVDKRDFEDTMRRISSLEYEIPKIDVKLKGGERIGKFEVLHVPGHTRGHIALFDGEILIVGDAVRNVDKISPPLDFFCWDYEKAVESYKRLISLPYRLLIPFHGEIFSRTP